MDKDVGPTPAHFVSPSEQDGIPPSKEALQLACAADLIRESSDALRLSQPICVTAQLLLHRFYTRVSLRAHCTIWACGAALLLAAKLADDPRSIRDIANVLHDRLQEREGSAMMISVRGEQRRRPLDYYGASGYDWKHELIAAERHLLKELGFRVLVELPHKFVLIFVNALRDKSHAPAWAEEGVGEFRKLLQEAWKYANDVMRGRVCVSEEPEAIACACIALGVARCGGWLPEGWQVVFGSEITECARVCEEIEALYNYEKTRGKFVDYSLCTVFENFREGKGEIDEGEDSVGGRRGKKRNRFEDKPRQA